MAYTVRSDRMLKIYTSRYQNPELSNGSYTVVGITRGAPKFPLRYVLAGNIIEIAPPGYLFNEYDRTRFTRPYFIFSLPIRN